MTAWSWSPSRVLLERVVWPIKLGRVRVPGRGLTRGNVSAGTAAGKKLLYTMLFQFRGAVRLALHVQPGAKRNAIVGVHGNALKIAISAPPVDGRANEFVRIFVADALGIPAGMITVVAGASSRQKVLSIEGVSLSEVQARVDVLLQR